MMLSALMANRSESFLYVSIMVSGRLTAESSSGQAVRTSSQTGRSTL
ncbi:hypothetical protein EVA_01131 [gut metagenome]|uniref:Uncharacterized protein n=1 Tax=gut metagenome TaxID=749906 RepID=J9H834_9ZZZZ